MPLLFDFPKMNNYNKQVHSMTYQVFLYKFDGLEDSY